MLLKNLKNPYMAQTDATYKIIWQGYAVVISGNGSSYI